MPSIIFKKTLKVSDHRWLTEKILSFHGAIDDHEIAEINHRLKLLQPVHGANMVQFERYFDGNYRAEMNHDYQAFREEDTVVTILDAMEEFGYRFTFQYDEEIFSQRLLNADSVTKKELFIFHKPS